MPPSESDDLDECVAAIAASKLSLYDSIADKPNLWLSSDRLELLLNRELVGTSLAELPLRTRSKVVKELLCRAIGYPVPKSFKKTQPRFPGQCFDVYVQKSNNLQIWNEELSASRRYVLIRISRTDQIVRVKVVSGSDLAKLDTSGTLTQKHQARCAPRDKICELIASEDTTRLKPFVKSKATAKRTTSPTAPPAARDILPIGDIYRQLKTLVGKAFDDRGIDQERNRGAALHQLVCRHLGYPTYQDDGRFPDIRHQLLEIKLQTAATIDLGLVCPNSHDPLDVPKIGGEIIRHCDVRYAIFYASTDGSTVRLTHFFLTTGETFFSRFPQFGGKVLNKKIQIPLPNGFFGIETEGTPDE